MTERVETEKQLLGVDDLPLQVEASENTWRRADHDPGRIQVDVNMITHIYIYIMLMLHT